MPRKKKEPLAPVPASPEARQAISEITGLLSQIIQVAGGEGRDLSMADQRRVWTFLSNQLTFASNSHKHADGQPFVAEVATYRYRSITNGLTAGGMTIEEVAREAGISNSAVSQILLRHQEHLDDDPARREIAKQRRIEAARRAMDRKKAELERRDTERAIVEPTPALDADTAFRRR